MAARAGAAFAFALGFPCRAIDFDVALCLPAALVEPAMLA
jgi:hypothetical protein